MDEPPPMLPLESIRRTFRAARAAGRRRRWAISGPPRIAGLLMCLLSVGLMAAIAAGLISWSYRFLVVIALMNGMLFLLLSALPGDTRTIWAISRGLVVLLAFAASYFVYRAGRAAAAYIMGADCACYDKDIPGPLQTAGDVAGFVIFLSSDVFLVLGLAGMLGHRTQLEHVWRAIGFLSGLTLGMGSAFGMTLAMMDKALSFWGITVLAIIGEAAISSAVSLFPNNRAVLHVWLARRSEEISIAAGIASLMGSVHPETLLADACSRFCAVDLSPLVRAFNMQLQPEELVQCGSRLLATPAQFGEIDAFVSHSWHDQPLAKWKALAQWAALFDATHARAPRVWMDQFCLDRTQINVDLACLPVYLAGCRRLLLLVGPTFFDRLWCLAEIWLYLQIGSAALIEIEFCTGTSHEEAVAFHSRPDLVDAGRASCLNLSDKTLILSFIEAACGSVEAFNERAGAIVRRALLSQDGPGPAVPPHAMLRPRVQRPGFARLDSSGGGGGGAGLAGAWSSLRNGCSRLVAHVRARLSERGVFGSASDPRAEPARRGGGGGRGWRGDGILRPKGRRPQLKLARSSRATSLALSRSSLASTASYDVSRLSSGWAAPQPTQQQQEEEPQPEPQPALRPAGSFLSSARVNERADIALDYRSLRLTQGVMASRAMLPSQRRSAIVHPTTAQSTGLPLPRGDSLPATTPTASPSGTPTSRVRSASGSQRGVGWTPAEHPSSP